MFGFVRQFAVILLLALAVAPAHAQQPPPDPIPRELGLALLSVMGGDVGTGLRTGRPADGFPMDVLPLNTIVLGSNDANGIPLTVIRLQYGFGPAADSLRSVILSRGWRPTETGLPSPRGFAAPSRAGRGGRGAAATEPTSFCKGTEMLSFQTPSPGAAGSSLITIRHSRNNLLPPCAASPRRSILDDTPMPLLLPPIRATVIPGGSGGGGDEFRSDARVTLVSTVADVVKHYSLQLVTAGWTFVDSASNKGVASHSFTKNLPNSGGTWDLLISGFLLPDQGVTQMYLLGKMRR